MSSQGETSMRHLIFIALIALLLIPPIAATTVEIKADYNAYVSETTDANWTTMRNDAGDGISINPATYVYVGYGYATTTAEEYTYIRNGLYTFPTYTLPYNADISAVKLSTYGIDFGSSLGTYDYSALEAHPADPRSFATTDYSKTTFTRLAPDIPKGDFGANWMNHTFNAYGISKLNKTGNTTVMMTSAAWTDNIEPVPWVASGTTGYRIYSVAASSGAYCPFLTVTYTLDENAPGSNFTATPTYGRPTLSVAFTDTTTHYPRTWNWSVRNDTVGWAVFSQSQNPTVSLPAGTYDINLTTTNDYGTSTETKNDYIYVSQFWPDADFTASPLYGGKPLTVVFTDASNAVGASAWRWNFGDGNSTNSTVQNPIHTYLIEGTYTVSLNVTNASGYDLTTKPAYIKVYRGATPVRGDHPYLYFHNITEVSCFLNRTFEPCVTYEADIKGHADAAKTTTWTTTDPTIGGERARDAALYYHICSNSGGSGCIAYLNASRAALFDMNTSFGLGKTAYPIRMWDGMAYAVALRDYAIAYDLIQPTLSAGNNTSIRNNLSYWMNDSYASLPYYNGVYSPEDINYADRLYAAYPSLGIVGEVLYDYTGRTYASTPAEWASMLDEGMFVNGSPYIGDGADRGIAYIQINKSSGASTTGAYTTYGVSDWAYFPKPYSRIYGNIFTMNPEFKKYYFFTMYQKYPNSYWSNYQSMGSYMIDATTVAQNLMSDADYAQLQWSTTNSSEMWAANVLPNNTYIGPQFYAFPAYLTVENKSSVSPTAPTALNWFSNAFAVMRSGWDENANWISFTARDETTDSNRINSHADQLSVDIYGKGDNVMSDGGEVKRLGVMTYHHSDGSHNILMVSDPRVAFTADAYTNLTARGAGDVIQNPANMTANASGPGVSFISGHTELRVPEDNYTADQKFTSPIFWDRGIISPMNEYFVIVDRATSAETWNYKTHWQFNSVKGNNAGTYFASLATVSARARGDLFIGANQYDWNSSTPWLETNTSVNTNTVVWNTTNERGTNISTKLFSVPSRYVSYFGFTARTGGYTATTSANHEWVNPHIFFNTPAATSMYRISSVFTNWETDTARPAYTELAVTGTGTAMAITNDSKTDTFYTGLGTSAFSTFQTTGDTAYVRNSTTGVNNFLLTNATNLTRSGSTLLNSTQRLSLVTYNRTAAGNVSMNVSGSGSTTIIIPVSATPGNFKIDGAAAGASVTADNITFSTSLSDHVITWDEGGGFPTPTPTSTTAPTNVSVGPTVPGIYCPQGLPCIPIIIDWGYYLL